MLELHLGAVVCLAASEYTEWPGHLVQACQWVSLSKAASSGRELVPAKEQCLLVSQIGLRVAAAGETQWYTVHVQACQWSPQ